MMDKISINDIKKDLEGIVEFRNDEILNCHIEKFQDKLDFLIKYAIFSSDANIKEFCRNLIKKICIRQGIQSCSLYDFYKYISQKDRINFTVPAINLRTLTYDIACSIFKLCKKLNTNLVIFEIAKSEISYTNQRPDEYITSIYAAALKQNYKGPIFLQGDHFQINRNNYFIDNEKEMKDIETLINEAIEAEFYNIDIDASTLVDIKKRDLKEQQLLNYESTAYFIKKIRERQPKDIMINIGAEIGEIGSRNSTLEDLDAFMEGLNSKLKEYKITNSITKISIQTGTTHGGIILPDGKLAEVNIDFSTIEKLSEAARKKYGLAGVVQHGASTLPKELFLKFPLHQTLEIHLATEFQNLILDNPYFPYRDEINEFIKEKYKDALSKITMEQFLYKYRKNALGEFKEKIWMLPKESKQRIIEEIEKFLEFIFLQLNIKNIDLRRLELEGARPYCSRR